MVREWNERCWLYIPFQTFTIYVVYISGRQFDKTGQLSQWWEDSVIVKFNEQTQCMIDQYSNFVLKEVNLNVSFTGNQTCGNMCTSCKQNFFSFIILEGVRITKYVRPSVSSSGGLQSNLSLTNRLVLMKLYTVAVYDLEIRVNDHPEPKQLKGDNQCTYRGWYIFVFYLTFLVLFISLLYNYNYNTMYWLDQVSVSITFYG